MISALYESKNYTDDKVTDTLPLQLGRSTETIIDNTTASSPLTYTYSPVGFNLEMTPVVDPTASRECSASVSPIHYKQPSIHHILLSQDPPIQCRVRQAGCMLHEY